MDDSANGFNNGGWDSEIEGFWVAKYAAGWQNGTNGVDTSIGTPEYSSLTYQTSGSSSTYVGTISNNSTKMSYPVFKANNYAYNYISVGDAYTLSQDIKNAARYGLNSTVDSHLEKNSEWGAVAYLSHSKYGVNGQDLIKVNVKILSNSPTGVYAVTSYGENDNNPNNVGASTTQNMSGVFDLSGCVWEYIATFYKGASETSYIAGMPTGSSSKYVTLYTVNDKKGDAIDETGGWNDDVKYFVTSDAPVFRRGGAFDYTKVHSGIYAFYSWFGRAQAAIGFRAVLVAS